MGRIRDAMADDPPMKRRMKAKSADGDHKAMMQHALGLAHYLNKMKKSGRFAKKGA